MLKSSKLLETRVQANVLEQISYDIWFWGSNFSSLSSIGSWEGGAVACIGLHIIEELDFGHSFHKM